MKTLPLLLAASLVTNVALVAYVATRPAASAPATSAPRASLPSSSSASRDALLAALASGDPAALEAAGVPAHLARELALGRTFARLGERMRGLQAAQAQDGRWWRSRFNQPGAREQQLLARRELSEALFAAFGDDFGLLGGDPGMYAFLSPEKRLALRRITQDYDEMMAKFGANGLQLASDKEKLRLLRAERDRDIAALLTPAEREAYEMRTSTSASLLRARYGEAIESEEEFRTLYALQKAFDEKYPRDALTGRISPETLRARAEGERQLEADMRAALGDDRYATLKRASDSDSRTLATLADRLSLPTGTTDSVLALRESLAAESQRITNDASLTVPQRRAQIQELSNRAKTDLQRTLGAEGAEAYTQRSPWVSMLQNGMAYSTTPQANSPAGLSLGSQSVYPVMPAGTSSGGTTRQVVVNGTPAVDFVGVGTAENLGGTSNVQVMTFTSSTSSSSGTTPPAQPATPAPAPTPATPPAQTPGR